jgi:RNA polymerase sigma-70 factor, ECF subfamily
VDGEITLLLDQIRVGHPQAAEQLAVVVYDRLHAISSRIAGPGGHDRTLGPTALLHEGFLKLLRSDALKLARDRYHLYALAARAMRQVMVDYIRNRACHKRAGQVQEMDLDLLTDYCRDRQWDLMILDEALTDLESCDPRAAEVTMLKFFAGLSVSNIAEIMDLSESTVEADWRSARARLRSRMRAD